jgi:hypothetical protein
MKKLNVFGGRHDAGLGLVGSIVAVKRACPAVLAAMASLAVAYGFEIHPLAQFGGSLPLSDMAPGLAQAFAQLGNLPIPALARHERSSLPLG